MKKQEAINFELPQSAKDFLEYLKVIKNKSEGTRSGYEIDLKMFFEFLITYKKKNKINNNFIKGITLKDLYAFMGFLEEKIKDKDGNEKSRNDVSTRARKVATLKSYFNYLQNKEKIITSNPAFELETPKIPDKKVVFLNKEESKHLLESLDSKNKNYIRDLCILTIFLNTGLRVSELYELKVKMIQGDKIVVLGKGMKIRDIFLNSNCQKAINDYLEVRNTEGVSDKDKEYLFLSSRKKRMEKITIQAMVKKHLGEAGFGEEIHTHSLRASFATNVYSSGKVGIKTVSELLGHSSISTTSRYLGVSDEDKRNAVSDIY